MSALVYGAYLAMTPLVADGSDPTTTLLNYGVLGVLVILLLTGMLVTKGQNLREQEISNAVLASNAKLADAAERMADAWEAQARQRAGGSG